MTTQTMTTDRVVSGIDLSALHAAYLSERFVDVSTEDDVDAGYTVYTKQGDLLLTARVPVVPVDDSDLFDYLVGVHAEARQALLFLWEVTGNAHFEVGSLRLAPSLV